MPKEGAFKLEGKIIDTMPNATFRVQLDNGHEIIAYVSGKMRKHFIRLITGDQVEVEISPYDLSKGRITLRKTGRSKRDNDEESEKIVDSSLVNNEAL